MLVGAFGAAAEAMEPYDDGELPSSSIPGTPSPSLATSFYHERVDGDENIGTVDERAASFPFDVDKLIDALRKLENEDTKTEDEDMASFITRHLSKTMAATLHDSFSNVRAVARALEFQLDQNVNAETV